jgi:hypothetical protein
MPQPKKPALSVISQWIGEDAHQAQDAYRAGNTDLLEACLDSIARYAADLGYDAQRTPKRPTHSTGKGDTPCAHVPSVAAGL